MYPFQQHVARRRDQDSHCLRRLVGHNALHRCLQAATVDTAMDIVIEQLIQSDLQDDCCSQKNVFSLSNDVSLEETHASATRDTMT